MGKSEITKIFDFIGTFVDVLVFVGITKKDGDINKLLYRKVHLINLELGVNQMSIFVRITS